jgi:small subunit ribosomal protein S8
MFFNHPVSDLVARVRNGYLAKKEVISSPFSKLRENILQILREEGYISNYSILQQEDSFKSFNIQLKYQSFLPAISEIEVISKPGKRVYSNVDEIPLVKNGLGLVIISTSRGVVADHEARSKNIGGELLLKVF